MKQLYPFGSPLKKVEQVDKTPKKVFVLGVYASAVHAKWIGVDGKTKVNALVVAGEPYIFWKGDGATEIIEKIKIPAALGTLVPADERFNGPSGNVLDDLYLRPLGYTREDAWLCDLLPYSRVNPNQQKAIEAKYNPMIRDFNLPECTIPQFSSVELNNPLRKDEILAELAKSQADTILLLGDAPIKHFLSYFSKASKLSDFGKSIEKYGRIHQITIDGKIYQVIPLVHPRQAGKLGRSSQDWSTLHEKWTMEKSEENIPNNSLSQIRVSKKPRKCPICGSDKIASYLWGEPILSEKLQKDINEGKVAIGGCCINPNNPFCICMDCKTDFFRNQIH